MKSRKDLQRMEHALRQVKNPLKQFNGPGDEKKDKGLKPFEAIDNRNIFEKGYDYLTGSDSRTQMIVDNKTVKFTDKQGNLYDESKNRIN